MDKQENHRIPAYRRRRGCRIRIQPIGREKCKCVFQLFCRFYSLLPNASIPVSVSEEDADKSNRIFEWEKRTTIHGRAVGTFAVRPGV